MASKETMEKAMAYLKKHTVSEEKFGWGPFLETNPVELFASELADGGIVVRANGIQVDCRSIAVGLYKDIYAHDPELKPCVMIYQNGDRHNWVEIRDPDSGETVQIDPTPWHACINPGHTGRECPPIPTESRFTLALVGRGGMPLTVRTTEKRQITTFVSVTTPSASSEHKEKMAGSCVKLPNYRFTVFAIEDSGFFRTEQMRLLRIAFEVPDAAALETALSKAPKSTINALIAAGIVTIGLAPHPYRPIAPIVSIKELEQTINMKSKMISLFAEIKRNLPAIRKMLEGAKSSLHVHGSESILDLKTGLRYDKKMLRESALKPIPAMQAPTGIKVA